MKYLLIILLLVFSRTGETFAPSFNTHYDYEEFKIATPYYHIEATVEHAQSLLESMLHSTGFDTLSLTTNAHLISALYYSDTYRAKVRANTSDSTANQLILRNIYRTMTTRVRDRCMRILLAYANNHTARMPRASPLTQFKYGTGKNHPRAIDLFVKQEGVNIYSISSGLVLLAESGWQKGDPTLTSSDRGGNTVIILGNDGRLFRYAHLDKVAVCPGDIVTSGAIIGTVGHTGHHASMAGHGKHLHLEVHAYSTRKRVMYALNVKELKSLLKSTKRT